MADETQNTLRDTLTSQFDAAEAADPIVQEEAAPVVQATPDRARDEAGKFAPKPKEVVTEGQPAPVQAAPQQPEVQRPQRPSTWKKDHWESFDKLAAENPALAAYINQRESEYKTGVSTYKAEADNARGLNEAIAPFMPDLQKNNIDPKVWISNLGNAHRKLALGSPDEKLQMFAQLARDYGVPLPGLEQQGHQNPVIEQLWQTVQQLQGKLGTWETQNQARAEAEVTSIIEAFGADTEKHPHFESVRASMGQLLESGLAPDLETAYKLAVRMDDGLFDGMVNSHQQQSAAQQQATVQKAKSQAFSPKTSTPTGTATATGPKDLRSQIAEAMSRHEGGRL